MNPQEVIARYLTAYNRLRTRTGAQILAAWRRAGGIDDAAARAWLATAVPITAGAQAATASLVAGYISLLGRAITGTATATAADPDAVTTEALRGVPAAAVYMRPVITARRLVGEGRPLGDALRIAGDRARSTAETDVLLAQRATTVDIAEREPRIVGYRRVLTGGSCALCATASTQRYHSEDLMPIHNNCDCGVAPIWGDRDPGNVINRELVADLKAAARTTGDPDYWRARHVTVDEDGTVRLPEPKVRQHGELGPVLTDSAHDFAGPGSVD